MKRRVGLCRLGVKTDTNRTGILDVYIYVYVRNEMVRKLLMFLPNSGEASQRACKFDDYGFIWEIAHYA